MKMLNIKISWEGPFSVNEVIQNKNDRGKPPEYGNDFGLYQIYGTHILSRKDTLLYIGKAPHQTFSARFKQHKQWLDNEDNKDDLKVYLGRIYNPKRHTSKDNWRTWTEDVELAEKILIYKYSPNYNNSNIGLPPKLKPFDRIKIVHTGARYKLHEEDDTYNDF